MAKSRALALQLSSNMKNKIIVSAALAALLFSAAPVSAQDSDGVQLGGQLRFRTADTAPEIGATTTSYTGRMRLNMATEVDSATKVFVELQTGGGISSDLGELDLHQGYMTISGFAGGMFDVKAGRMELSYGNQRMLSALDWNDAGRAWDGLVFQHATADHTLDVIYSKPVQNQMAGVGTYFGGTPTTYDMSSSVDVLGEMGSLPSAAAYNLAGLYYQRAISGWDTDVYLFNRVDGDRDDLTLGALVEGNVSGVGLSGEFAMQSGDATSAIEADGTAMALNASYALGGGMNVGVAYESSDSFQTIADFSHAYHGHMDLFQWSSADSGLTDIVLKGSMPIDDVWKWYGNFHMFTDTLSGDALGNELDLGIKGNFSDSVGFWGGYSMFMDDYAEDEALESSWLFAQIVVNF